MPTILLCHCDGTNGSTTFTDVSTTPHTLTALGSAQVSTAAPMFGTGCAAFNVSGTNQAINTNSSADFRFGAGQFTVEAWVKFPATPGASLQAVLAQFMSTGNQYGWFFGWTAAATFGFYYSANGSTTANVSAAYTIPTNTWVHVAADRDASNVLRIYANGVVLASATVAVTFFASTANCMIGNDSFGTEHLPGFIDDVRVTTGVAIYGGAFTPSGPLTNYVASGASPVSAMVLA